MTEVDHQGGRRSERYQVVLVAILGLNFGILFFDRNALNILMPFVKTDLGLNNTQVGMLASALSLAWAIAGVCVGRYADNTGRRKSTVIFAGLVFSACSFLSGIATTFLGLFAARLVMGSAEGGVLPISQSLIADEVSAKRRGLAMGLMQNLFSNILGSAVGPVLLVAISLRYGWRSTFFFAGLPGLISALAIWLIVKPPFDAARSVAPSTSLPIREALKPRNIRLCALIAVLSIAYIVVFWAFMPLYLTQVRGFSPEKMGLLMATGGVSAAIAGFVVSGISDYVGRKPVMIIAPIFGVLLPLGAMYFQGSGLLLALIFFLGWISNGAFPLFMAIIPSETVDPRHTATVLGLVMGIGEAVGGVISPSAAGTAADAFGLSAPLWIMLALCILTSLLGFALIETAPRKLRKAQAGALSGQVQPIVRS